jgi:hypothetical protein
VRGSGFLTEMWLMMSRYHGDSDRQEGGHWPFWNLDDSEFYDCLCKEEVIYGEDGGVA